MAASHAALHRCAARLPPHDAAKVRRRPLLLHYKLGCWLPVACGRYAHTVERLLEVPPVRSLMVSLPAAVEAWRERFRLRAAAFRTVRHVTEPALSLLWMCFAASSPPDTGRMLVHAAQLILRLLALQGPGHGPLFWQQCGLPHRRGPRNQAQHAGVGRLAGSTANTVLHRAEGGTGCCRGRKQQQQQQQSNKQWGGRQRRDCERLRRAICGDRAGRVQGVGGQHSPGPRTPRQQAATGAGRCVLHCRHNAACSRCPERTCCAGLRWAAPCCTWHSLPVTPATQCVA